MTVVTEKEIRRRDSFDIVSKVSEIGTAEIAPSIAIPADWMERIRDRDPSPEFVTVEVESGMSESKRNWPGHILKKCVDVVNKRRPVGYKGHISEKDDHTAFPPVQTVWLGARFEERNGKTVAFFKGYNIPGREIRDDLAFDAVSGVSIRGDARMRPAKGGGYDVVDFDLESIDWARKNREGMNGRVLSVTSEMKEGLQVTPDEIRALTPEDIKTHAPLIHKALVEEATTPLETKVSEMTTAAAAVEPEITTLKQLRTLLGIEEGANPVETVTALLSKVEALGKADIKEFIRNTIAKKVKDEKQQKLVHRLIGEMHTQFDGDLTDDLKSKIESEIDAKIEGDEDIKEIVGEMRSDSDNGGTRGGAHLGGRSRRPDGAGEDGVVKKNDRMTVRKVKVGS